MLSDLRFNFDNSVSKIVFPFFFLVGVIITDKDYIGSQ